jgi:hypothetical protein
MVQCWRAGPAGSAPSATPFIRWITIAGGIGFLFVGYGSGLTSGQSAMAAYPSMAPLAQYLLPSPDDEITLARSAAPPEISKDAEILTFSPKGYETAVKGNNGFVCLVERSWDKNFNGEFWNPKIRSPHCLNAPAARSVLSTYLKRTEWVLSGASKAEMLERTKSAVAAHQIPEPEVGSMAYMMSKDGYIGDDAGGPWHPHLMFYLPHSTRDEWGANLKGSPIVSDPDAEPMAITFFVPVSRWSDGTPEVKTQQGHPHS